MTNDKYLEDIKEIKSLMNKSTRFISLSGMSGIMAGVYALIGSVIGHFIIQNASRKVAFLNKVVSGSVVV